MLRSIRKWSQLIPCEVKDPPPELETFEYKGSLYDKKKFIESRSKDLLDLGIRDIEYIKKVAIEEPYAQDWPEYYAAELEAFDRALIIKLEKKLNRRSFLEFLGFKEEKKK